MELGCDKFPPEEELFIGWHENHEALIAFLEAVSPDSVQVFLLLLTSSIIDQPLSWYHVEILIHAYEIICL